MLGISGIVRIFEEIEQRLVQSLRRNLSRHKEEEEQEGFNWSAWQAEKLRALEKFRRENAAIMQEYTEQIDTETRQIMQEQFDEGVNGVDVPPAVPAEDVPAEIQPEPHFFGVDTTKVNKLIEDVTYLEKNAETAALRLTDDVYRQTVNRVQLAMGTGSMNLQQAIDMAVKDFLNQGINCIVYKDGRRVNIADYVRMALRTTATRAALQGKSAKYKALGYDTVQVSSYGMCSPTCKPWQGRIYIEDTFSFWDGEVREQGGILWGKSGYCGKWFPLLSSAIEKGLFHPNCRHTILLWRDGDPLPESVDNSDSERRYKLEQQQRALEREIRKAKRKVNGFTDPANIKKAKAELRQAQKNLKDFIDKVNAEEGETVLKRDYGREKVYESEVPKAAEPVKESAPPEAEIKEVPEIAPEPPVSDAPVPEGKAVEVTVSEPEKTEGAYTDEKIPEQQKFESYALKGSADIQFDRLDGSKSISSELAEEYRTEYDKFTEMFGELPSLNGIDIAPYANDDTYGQYYPESRRIVIYGAGGKSGDKFLLQSAQEHKRIEEWSTGSKYHSFRHELGHALQMEHSLNDKYWEKKKTEIEALRSSIVLALTNSDGSVKIKELKGKLSKYGFVDTDEFISECVAEYFQNPKKARSTSKKVIEIIMRGDEYYADVNS